MGNPLNRARVELSRAVDAVDPRRGRRGGEAVVVAEIAEFCAKAGHGRCRLPGTALPWHEYAAVCRPDGCSVNKLVPLPAQPPVEDGQQRGTGDIGRDGVCIAGPVKVELVTDVQHAQDPGPKPVGGYNAVV